MNQKQVVFDDIFTLAKYIKQQSVREMTPLRLQKTLYFLFAFYGATLGKLSEDNQKELKFEGSYDYPKYLFKENFEAWQYGPVIREIYMANKHNNTKINSASDWVINGDKDETIKELLDQVITQTDQMGDFTLVERSHEDESWKSAFEAGQAIMNKEEVVREYKREIV